MNSTSDTHHRRSIRLRSYDYGQSGAYFVTICVKGRECLFGQIIGEDMRLEPCGEVVQDCWDELPRHFPHVELDEFAIMPNHVHGIIFLNDTPVPAQRAPAIVGAQHAAPNGVVVPNGVVAPIWGRHAGPLWIPTPPIHQSAPLRPNVPPGSLGAIVRSFKSATTKRINEMRSAPGVPVWQRNYYEHIVRNDDELNLIREYIQNNPAQWALDMENPDASIPPVGGQHAGPHWAQHAAPLRGVRGRDDIERIFGRVRP